MTTKLLTRSKSYIIRHKQTKERWKSPSGKTVWKESWLAWSAWYGAWWEAERSRLDDQSEYEIIELTDQSENLLERAIALLKLCRGCVDCTMKQEIESFLIDVEKGE